MTVLPEHIVHEHITRRLDRIERLILRVLIKENMLMSDIEDLKTALADLAAEAVGDLENVIAQLEAALSSNNTAALQALTQQAKDATAKLKTDMSALTAPPTA